ncbi:hypothetical protein HBI17_230460 [Parastagonospora nodorum]|nr:hypothetical protein HBI17_230460 [Parastagonospora nodorum]KAH6368782.1 hypothetical protein HBI34_125520 [Parastagonospora nodorum]
MPKTFIFLCSRKRDLHCVPCLASYTGSSIFEDQTPLPASSHAGLSQTAIIILISTIPIVLCFAIVFGIVRVVRRRNKRILQAKRQADIERRLRDRAWS